MVDAPYLLIVDARYYADISDELVRGALGAIEEVRGSYMRVSVPGAFELPAAIHMAIRSMELVGGRRRYDGYVALGCVIRGETSHYDHICMEATRGLNDIAMNFSVAVGNGILTCETREQALARAATNQGNKGAQAARAAIEMVRVKRELMPAR